MIVAVAKMLIVKRLKTAMQKNSSFLKQLSNNPKSFQKLAKDPQVAQVSAMMKKNGFRFTKDSVNQLRSAAGKDPAKRGVLEAIKGISKTKPLTIFEVVILLLVIASGPLVLGMILAIPDSATFR
ncbi:hypothetical protein PF008_g26260 [Phytophthora fragariae]|uniref:Uncharacterized protein n=1 Tax=Phytophthora fragariae TaxID=53985 RepID=A0A6G0QHJ9_9STRA|nr:hypothetical protein PF008_g26260 [Phytophthora fragariae]